MYKILGRCMVSDMNNHGESSVNQELVKNANYARCPTKQGSSNSDCISEEGRRRKGKSTRHTGHPELGKISCLAQVGEISNCGDELIEVPRFNLLYLRYRRRMRPS